MDKQIVKQIGIASVFVLGLVLVRIIGAIGSITLSGEDFVLISGIIGAGAYIIYILIKKFTGAQISDVSKILDFIKKITGEDEGGEDETGT